jgi:predicted ester cyclase
MKGLMAILPDGSYKVKSFATDVERSNVAAYAVFSGTHTGCVYRKPKPGRSGDGDRLGGETI